MTAAVAATLERATRDARLLDHPFYRAWADGRLTRDDLAFYATQYWRQVESFPRCLERLAARAGSEAAAILRTNLADEVGDDHPALWLEFARAVGAGADEVVRTPAEPETGACVEAFAEACERAPVSYALGMLYGYESQTPEVAATKVAGLRAHYGIGGGEARYFELHGELDVEHARELATAIASECGDGGLGDAEAGAGAGARAVWGLLDGVARVRGI